MHNLRPCVLKSLCCKTKHSFRFALKWPNDGHFCSFSVWCSVCGGLLCLFSCPLTDRWWKDCWKKQHWLTDWVTPECDEEFTNWHEQCHWQKVQVRTTTATTTKWWSILEISCSVIIWHRLLATNLRGLTVNTVRVSGLVIITLHESKVWKHSKWSAHWLTLT